MADKRSSGALNPSEFLRLKKLVNSLVSSQEILNSTLDEQEQSELFSLLRKIGFIELEEDTHSSISIDSRENNHTNVSPISSTRAKPAMLKLVVGIISNVAIFSAVVAMPTLVAFYATQSIGSALVALAGSTAILIIGIGSLMGKISWGMAIALIPVIATVVLTVSIITGWTAVASIAASILAVVLTILAFLGRFSWRWAFTVVGSLLIPAIALIVLLQM